MTACLLDLCGKVWVAGGYRVVSVRRCQKLLPHSQGQCQPAPGHSCCWPRASPSVTVAAPALSELNRGEITVPEQIPARERSEDVWQKQLSKVDAHQYRCRCSWSAAKLLNIRSIGWGSKRYQEREFSIQQAKGGRGWSRDTPFLKIIHDRDFEGVLFDLWKRFFLVFGSFAYLLLEFLLWCTSLVLSFILW